MENVDKNKNAGITENNSIVSRNGQSANQIKKIEKQGKNKNKNKSKNKEPKIPTIIPKKDHHERVTYLYKLGTLMAFKQFEAHSNQKRKSLDALSRKFLNHMDLVSKKAVLKLHPNIKRTICKKCSRLLINGLSSSTRIKNDSKEHLSHCDILEMKCKCGCIKRFPIGKNPEYTLFTERDDIIFDTEGKQ